MKINPVQITSPKLSISKYSPITSPHFKQATGDVFISTNETRKNNVNNPFDAKEDALKFNKMNFVLKKLKYLSIDKHTKDVAAKSLECAEMLKKYLDDEYKDNYVLVSIGTSPAGVMRAMEFMGSDVRYIPISNLYVLNSSKNLEKDLEKINTKKYKKFLSGAGISPSNINNQNKKYIFYDYTFSGISLNMVKNAMENHLGIDSSKTDFRSLNYDLLDLTIKESVDKYVMVNDYVDEYLKHSNISPYSGIPHLDCRHLENIDKLLAKPKKQKPKDFNFALLYGIEKNRKKNNRAGN